MSTGFQQNKDRTIPRGAGRKFGIVVSDYNSRITEKLLSGCIETLKANEVTDAQIQVIHVPGSFELPMGARLIMGTDRFDAVICLGCVIKGETMHDEYINHAISVGIMQLSLTSNIPIVFGVLTPNSIEQAEARAGGKHGNKGIEAAETALHMAALKKTSGLSQNKIGFA